VRVLKAFQGSPAIWVPDNLKATSRRPVGTSPRATALTPSSHAITARGDSGAGGAHYRQTKVEVSVQSAQRWVLAVLRHRTFFSLADLNAAMD
jgi:uncharacterized protein with FMN-binding domain